MRQAVLVVTILCSTSLLLAEAAWPQKAGDGRHSYSTTAPAVSDPGVYWVLDDIQSAGVGGPSTVIGENDDIYMVRNIGASYSIVELNRKGETVRTYMSASSSPVGSLAVTTDRLFAVVDGTLHAWVLGTTDISWSKSDDYISTVVLLDASDNVYVASYDNVYSIDPDGTPLWDHSIDASGLGAWPAYYGGAVFVIHDTHLTALNTSNGSQRWTKDITMYGLQNQHFTGPIIGPDGVLWVGRVVSSSVQDYILVDPNSGGSNLGIVLIYNEMLYAISDAARLIFMGSEHLLGWDYEMGAPSSATNIFQEDIGFTPTSFFTVASDHIYMGKNNGSLCAFSADDGTQEWQYPLDLDGAYPQNAMAIDQYGTLYVPLSDGSLAAVGEAPVAVATGPASGGVGAPISFSSAGSGPGIPTDTISYDWDFGDDTYSTEADPTKTYDTGGDYTVVLTVTVNETGATATHSIPFIADDVPPGIEVTEALLYGTVDDEHIPPTILVNGSVVPVTVDTWESGPITLETGGPTIIDIIATDANMNQSTVTVTITP